MPSHAIPCDNAPVSPDPLLTFKRHSAAFVKMVQKLRAVDILEVSWNLRRLSEAASCAGLSLAVLAVWRVYVSCTIIMNACLCRQRPLQASEGS